MLVLTLLLAACGALAGPTTFPKTLINGTHCLDGSPAGYYGVFNESSSEWAIYLEGGGDCHDKESCEGRAKTALGSSTRWGSTVSPRGTVLDGGCEANPIWCNVNRIYVPYCSGDVHIGQQHTAGPSTWNLYFSGRLNLERIISHLKAEHGLGAATTAVLSGGSAGGIGTFHNADMLTRSLPGAKVRALPIGGWFFPNVTVFPAWVAHEYIPPYNKSIAELWNMSGSLSQECLRKYGPDSPACFTMDTAVEFVRTPFLAGENSVDSQQLYGELLVPSGHLSLKTKLEVAFYIAYFQKQMLTSVSKVKAMPTNGIWMPSCFDHTGDINFGQDLTVQGYTWAKAVQSFWTNGTVPRYLIAPCATKNPESQPCSSGCPRQPPAEDAPPSADELALLGRHEQW